MIVKRFYLSCLAHASYLIADPDTRIAAIIDPQRDTAIYDEELQQAGWDLQYVILTHFHADFVAGHLELRDKYGAEIVLGARAQAEFAARYWRDGETLEFGTVRLEAWETPGHTPEGLSVLAYDLARDAAQPAAIFTGDTLFIGDVGRPDLLGSIGFAAEDLASDLYDSVRRMAELPDQTLVYPAHGAGSLCGKSLSCQAVSTIGEQKQLNYALQPMSREAFVKLVLEDQPTAPQYFVHDAIMNRREHSTLETSMRRSLKPLSVSEVLKTAATAQWLDTRSSRDFAAGHLRGSLNIGLEGKYATWAGTVLDPTRPIVVIADNPEESIRRLGRIGFDQVLGFLENGLAAMQDHPEWISVTQRVSPLGLSLLPAHHSILDVRTPAEFAAGAIPGSVSVPLNQLSDRIAELDPLLTWVVVCQSGYRSSLAVSLLQGAGWSHLYDLIGGYKAWEATQTALPA